MPSQTDIELRDTRARALRQAGRPEEAAGVLQDLLRVYAGHGQAHYELGTIYEEIGDAGAAEREYAAFLEKFSGADPGLPMVEDAQMRLAALRAHM